MSIDAAFKYLNELARREMGRQRKAIRAMDTAGELEPTVVDVT
jgi:hypothetical protein